jgi:hypothetical protein
MPETTVHEDGDAGLAKDKIRFARQGGVPAPASDSELAKDRDEPELGAFISVRPY